jgi:hypothetical protein
MRKIKMRLAGDWGDGGRKKSLALLAGSTNAQTATSSRRETKKLTESVPGVKIKIPNTIRWAIPMLECGNLTYQGQK